MVTSQLIADNFSWDWYDRIIGKKKKAIVPLAPKSCKELFEDFKKHWFRENQGQKNSHKQWYGNFRHIEAICKDENGCFDSSIIKKIIDNTCANSATRTKTINALLNLLDYCEINDFDTLIKKIKERNKPVKRKTHSRRSRDRICLQKRV